MSVATRRSSVALAALASGAILLAACGGAAPASQAPGTPAPSAVPGTPAPTSAPTSSPEAEAPQLLLQVVTQGGFINPAGLIGALPTVTVDTDGRIYTDGGMSPTVIRTALVRDTGAAGAAAIIEAIKAAGLDKDGGAATGPGLPDAGTTMVTVILDGVTYETRLGAGGPNGGNPGGIGIGGGVTPGGAGGGTAGGSGSDANAAALDLVARLQDPTVGWGGPAVAATEFVPSGYMVYAAPLADGSAAGSPGGTVAWPLATALAGFGSPAAVDFGMTGLHNGAVLGADATALAAAFKDAAAGTAITSGGASFTVWVRPLLPDELGG